jgi:hypothetical protein
MKGNIVTDSVILASHIIEPNGGDRAYRYVMRRNPLKDDEFVVHTQSFEDMVSWDCSYHNGFYTEDFAEAADFLRDRCSKLSLQYTYFPGERSPTIWVSVNEDIKRVLRLKRLFLRETTNTSRQPEWCIFAGAETKGRIDKADLYATLRCEGINVAIVSEYGTVFI